MLRKFFSVLIVASVLPLQAQVIPFDQVATDIGNIGLSISNVGTVGRPQVTTNQQGLPSMEYPLKSGINHLFEGGIWIGAMVNGQIRVSTSADDASSGYRAGLDGFEFTATGPISRRSRITSSEYYSTNAVSHQDFVTLFTDKNTIIPGTTTPIAGHSFPLRADVKLSSYAWNFSFADYFVILDYEITNNSTDTWDSVWVGQWNDLVVRNLNVTQDAGTAFYNKGGGGFIDSLGTIYAYEVLGDDIDFTQSYSACTILGVEWNGLFFYPSNRDSIVAKGYSAPKINPNFWIFNSSTFDDFVAPGDDVAKYSRLKTPIDLKKPSVAGQLNVGANLIQLISIGPLAHIKPGESFKYTMAYTAAKQLNGPVDNEAARQELLRNLGWVKRTYLGEDVQGKGVYRPELDVNKNGKLDRYILPEPPATPKVKIVPSSNKVDIYWNNESVNSIDPISKKHDFEGFRIYRTNPGDDKTTNIISQANLVAQWDSAGNSIGFNNGFQYITLPQPKYFEGDSTPYTFHYEMTGLLNGWQYLFIITAFDKGDVDLGLSSLESSFTENAFRVFSGTGANENFTSKNDSFKVGVYPNPYKTASAWDGTTSRTKLLYFYNLPAQSTVTIYNISGDVVASFNHDAATYKGEDIRWFDNFSDPKKSYFAGGEHGWDLLSTTKNAISSGTYLYTVKDRKTGEIQTGKFVILK